MNKTASMNCVGFIPVMAKLYERLLPDLKAALQGFSKQICGKLSRQTLRIECANVACTDQDIQAAVRRFEQINVDLLIIGHVSYCASGELLPGLLKTRLPIVLWPAQPMLELVGRRYDFQTVIRNHGVHGTQDLANVLGRNHRPFGLLHGHVRQPGFLEELFAWARAARAVTAMKQSHPVILGGHFDQMLDLQLDREPFVRKFGVAGRKIPLDAFLKTARKVSREQIQSIRNDYRSLFKIDRMVTPELLEKTARHEGALRTLVEKYDSHAVGINFQSLCNAPGIGDGLHVAASRLMAQGVGYGGEGDWVTAMLVRGLQAATQQASFSEIFSVGYRDNRLVLRHWGEGNFDLAREKPVLRSSRFTDQRQAEFGVLDFEFKPGAVTLVNLNATPDGEGQLITLVGKIEKERLPAVDGPRGIFKPRRSDIRAVLNDYGYRGGSHHLALVRGDAEDLIGKMARLAGWKWEKV